MLRVDPQRDPTFRPHWDPALRPNARNYRKFIQKLNDIKYLKYTLFPKEHAGVFFVWKSGRQKIRMIVDARAANRLFGCNRHLPSHQTTRLARQVFLLPPHSSEACGALR